MLLNACQILEITSEQKTLAMQIKCESKDLFQSHPVYNLQINTASYLSKTKMCSSFKRRLCGKNKNME